MNERTIKRVTALDGDDLPGVEASGKVCVCYTPLR